MSDKLADNGKWSMRDFHTHLELRSVIPLQFISIANVGELLELMDWLEKNFGHIREQRPTPLAPDVLTAWGNLGKCSICGLAYDVCECIARR